MADSLPSPLLLNTHHETTPDLLSYWGDLCPIQNHGTSRTWGGDVHREEKEANERRVAGGEASNGAEMYGDTERNR